MRRAHDSGFYCGANMPGAVPNTSTHALTNVTLLRGRAREQGLAAGMHRRRLALGVNTHGGHLINAAVGEATGLDTIPSKTCFADD